MKCKKVLSVLLTLIMIIGMMPCEILASTDCVTTDNIIDITDKTVYEKSGKYAKITNIKITNADVVNAMEDNTTIEIILSGDTPLDATIDVEFGTSLDRNMSMSGNKSSITLNNGSASLDMTLKGQYSSFDKYSATVTYTLNFSIERKTVPERLAETDNKSTYSGTVLNINLNDYFVGAKEYYIVDGDEKSLVDGKIYKFKSFVSGMYTLVFVASNDYGLCDELVTVTVEVKEEQQISAEIPFADEEPKQDEYHTDPAPSGMPKPIEPENVEISDKELTCTLSVRCDTIISNMNMLDNKKIEIVPKDGIILAEKNSFFL